LLCSKGAADHVTERTYGSKEKELLHWIAELEKEQKAEKGRLKTQVDKDAAGYVNSDGEVLREKEMALKRALEIEKEMALKMLEIKADEALMPELYREMSQWQKRNQWDIDHAEANKDGKIRMLSRMQDEV